LLDSLRTATPDEIVPTPPREIDFTYDVTQEPEEAFARRHTIDRITELLLKGYELVADVDWPALRLASDLNHSGSDCGLKCVELVRRNDLIVRADEPDTVAAVEWLQDFLQEARVGSMPKIDGLAVLRKALRRRSREHAKEETGNRLIFRIFHVSV